MCVCTHVHFGSIPSVYPCLLSNEGAYITSCQRSKAESILFQSNWMWHQLPSVLNFLFRILNVFSLRLMPSWVVRGKRCNIHQRGGDTVKSVACFCWGLPQISLLSLYLSLSLSYLSLSLINSYYHKKRCHCMAHTPMGATAVCTDVCITTNEYR